MKTIPTLLFATMLRLHTHAGDLKLGVIGLDTSHCTAFTELINDASHKDHVPGAKVIAAFRGGSPDIPSSIGRVEEYTAVLRDKYGVKSHDSIEEVCREVDAVMIESVDGRPHLAQGKVRPTGSDEARILPLSEIIRAAVTCVGGREIQLHVLARRRRGNFHPHLARAGEGACATAPKHPRVARVYAGDADSAPRRTAHSSPRRSTPAMAHDRTAGDSTTGQRLR